MEWRDEGALITMRLHGESAAIIEVFTAAHGRHAGVVRGGGSRRMAAMLQPGSQLQVTWSARLDEHLGTFVVEPIASRAAILADRRALAGLNAVCALLHLVLPERDPHPALWVKTVALLDLLATGADWPPAYLRWELDLLEELGFGLDLTRCAVTGSREDLAFVSPRSGRAVSRGAAGPCPSSDGGNGKSRAAQSPAAARDTARPVRGLTKARSSRLPVTAQRVRSRPKPNASSRSSSQRR